MSAVVGLAVARAGETYSEQATSRDPRRRGVFAFVFDFDLGFFPWALVLELVVECVRQTGSK